MTKKKPLHRCVWTQRKRSAAWASSIPLTPSLPQKTSAKSWQRTGGYDLIFLDVQFAKNEINGLQAGIRIREELNNNYVAIVYISWEDHAINSYEADPLYYLLKPLTREKIEKMVKTYLKRKGFSTGQFSYKKIRETVKIWIKDIVYLEAKGRKITVNRADGTHDDFYGTLKEVYEAQLKTSGFIFIHASYMVNYDYVTTIKYDHLLLKGGLSLPVSQNRRSDARQRYFSITQQRRLV